MHVSMSPPNPSQPTAPAYAPRRRPSSSEMICIARTLGAPETVPAGNVARRSAGASRPSAICPKTRETRCMTWE